MSDNDENEKTVLKNIGIHRTVEHRDTSDSGTSGYLGQWNVGIPRTVEHRDTSDSGTSGYLGQWNIGIPRTVEHQTKLKRVGYN